MPEKMFIELDTNKQRLITDVILAEFAEYSYNDSSTNRIVKNAGISKGSLFKYFSNKEDMYFYIIDFIMAAFTNDIKDQVVDLPQDIFERTIQYAEIEFDWYIKNPIKYKLFKKAFDKNDSDIYQKTETKYSLQGEDFYYKLFNDINFSKYSVSKEKLLNILKWVLEGFNRDYIDRMHTQKNIIELKKQYVDELSEYINTLKKGLK